VRKTLAKVLLMVANTPDYPEVIAAGTMAKHARDGWEVYQLVVGDGEVATTKYPVEEVKRMRREEQRKAAAIEGCKEVFFLGMPDGNIQNDYETKVQIRDYIRKLKPTIIITPYINSRHPDVRNTAMATVDAAFWAMWNRDSVTGTLAIQPPHATPIVYMAGLAGFDWDFRPEIFIDVTDVKDIKNKALEQHRSTWELPPYNGPERGVDRIQSLSKAWGVWCGAEYAEAFEPYWMLHYAKRALELLPVP
jgi:LmbE family N-acetylglucosaminyl deacetylase